MTFGPPSPLLSGMMLLGAGSSGGAAAPGPPGDPTGFTATAGNQLITLTWDALPAADTFEIKFSLTNNLFDSNSLAAGLTGTSFTFDSGESIQAGEKYYFWIQATNGEGTSNYVGSVTARSYVALGTGTNANLTTPAGSWTFGTLFFASSPDPIPNSTTVVYGVPLYIMVDGVWYDSGTEEDATGTSISGAFTFANNSGVTVTFWNGEP